MSEVVNGNMQDVLGAIRTINDKNIYSVYIPSLEKEIMFKEMTTKQEKMIVKTIVDNPVYNSEFIFAIRDIITENCAEEINIDELTIIDKTAICLTMRMKSVGNTFSYMFKNTDKSIDITISDYVEKFKTVNIPKDTTVGTDDIKVVCSYPSILTEYALEREFRSNIDTMTINDTASARDAIGTVFTNEIVKYIKEITIKRDGDLIQLNMQDYDFKNRVMILEELGNKTTNEIMGFIEKGLRDVKEALKIELPLTGSDVEKYGTEKLTSTLETGSDFFIIS